MAEVPKTKATANIFPKAICILQVIGRGKGQRWGFGAALC